MILVKLDDLPPRIKGFCYHDYDGNEFITINSRLSADQQRAVYDHEMRHIRNHDMENMDYHEYERREP